MARKKIHSILITPGCYVNVYRDSEYNEYVVKTVVDGTAVGDGYFTDDKQDAMQTAQQEAHWAERQVSAGERKRRSVRASEKRRDPKQGNWVPASGGSEVPFKTRTGRRLLYVYQHSTGDHAYLDLDTDMILTPEEARWALGID